MFSMQIIHQARSAFSRQLREAVEIGTNTTGGEILNNKEEFSRCLIPIINMQGPKNNIMKDTRSEATEIGSRRRKPRLSRSPKRDQEGGSYRPTKKQREG